MIIRLTEKGREEAEKISDAPDFGEELFADFSDEEKAEWTRLVEKLNERLKNELGEEDSEEFFGGGRGFDGPRPSHGHGPHGRGPAHSRHFLDFADFNW